MDEVANPNSENFDYSAVLKSCSDFAYMPLDGNRITIGVYKEIKEALKQNKLVLRINRDTLVIEPLIDWVDEVISYDETMQLINEKNNG